MSNEQKGIHPKIASIFRHGEDVSYLAKLNEAEQKELAQHIKNNIDREGGSLFAAVSMVSNLVPAFLKAKIAKDVMGPAMTARMATHITSKQAIATIKHFKPEFLADVAVHLEPDKVVEIVEDSPEHILVNISQQLVRRGQYEIMANFADHLSPAKLKVMANKLGDVMAIVSVANCMKNKDRLIRTAMDFDDDFLLRVMKGVAHYQYYGLAAAVGQEMPVARQIKLLPKLSSSEAAKLAAHYDPEVIAGIINELETEQVVNIAMELDGETLGKCFNFLDPEVSNRFIPYLNLEIMAKALPYVNQKKLEDGWETLLPKVQQIIENASGNIEGFAELFENLGAQS